jgi:hypothetical protein
MQKFQAGLTAHQAHAHLKTALSTLEAAQQNAILWFGEIVQRKLYRQLGYADIHLYARQELGWSRSKTYDFLKICRQLEDLPVIKEEVARGKLGYSHTRQLVKVADAGNEEEWLQVARSHSRRGLAQEVKRANRQAVEDRAAQPALIAEKPAPRPAGPQRVTFDMTPAQLARFEALWERLRKQGDLPAGRTEALLTVMAGFVSEPSNRLDAPDCARESASRPPVQIHVHQCPDCGLTTVPTAKGDLVLGREDVEHLECDARISRPGQDSTTTIPPRIRREVLARDGHRCQGPGCGRTRFLEIHHIVPRSRGGTHHPDNLITLCSSCHAQVHRGKGLVRERPPSYLGRRPISSTISCRLSGKWKESSGANCQNSSSCTVPRLRS